MPTYNGAAHLAAALDSIQIQNDSDLEILAVDDGSTDESLAILESFADRLPLTIVRNDHAGNWVASSNEGLSRACGDWVCFLHQDDLWSPHRLRHLREVVRQEPDVALVLTPSRFLDAHGKPVGRWRCPLPANTVLDGGLVQERLLVQNFIAVPAPLFRRRAAMQIGGLDDGLWYTADWDFWFKLAGAGKVYYLPECLAALRIHVASQTLVRSVQGGDFREQLQIVLDRHLPAWAAAHPARTAVRKVAGFSADVNAALAASFHGQKAAWFKLACRFAALGPSGWHRYLRDSRVFERVRARLRAGMATTDSLAHEVAAEGQHA
jgi:hypothetical protein